MHVLEVRALHERLDTGERRLEATRERWDRAALYGVSRLEPEVDPSVDRFSVPVVSDPREYVQVLRACKRQVVVSICHRHPRLADE
jgi:hypothetical protein